ncbi:nucleoside triphosphate pyrophosphohydrolase [Wenzhouxiangella sp. XN79A]|uniref:nucleoside triphosphate pyrophosphohydrolase n=1 Tax=Wenzhouxiangella sp. XN79A TaxID=2724193 RepID=UPI00144A8513|nr:nucleoside triphosphate pyrophosphohydrolase [Wenzhouxiangella sp. XN79A]NKI34114.1 nucleoside triphosphate pyrophosphohydrolase [Wenzhouxiangella sp. XN79A]
MSENHKALDRILEVMDRLRDPVSGCPWDLEQDFRSIAPYTIEEAHEVADAIESGDLEHVRDELGDLLFQVVFHARLGREAGAFGFAEVANGIADKLIRRHPHVFGDAPRMDADEQTANWEAIKEQERAAGGAQSALDGVSGGLPPLRRAVKLQKRAGRVGFDWPDIEPVLAKIREELDELEAELDPADRDRLEDELGDVLFAVANLARKLDLDPDAALRRTNHKFERRFRAMEAAAEAEGRPLAERTLDEQEAVYQRVKADTG